MARTEATKLSNGTIHNEKANGSVTVSEIHEEKTDYARWRLLDERGRQTWHYLQTDEEVEQWPQSTADKYHLGLPTGLPNLQPPKTPLASAHNALTFFSALQLPPGNWACEYGGPLFLLPGLVIAWYVTQTPIPPAYATEIKNYLFARQNAEDGGWGLHIEGESSVFGTAMNYVVCRLLGADAEDPRMVRARALLHELGGAVNGPHWAKFWLSVLGVCEWEIVNPVPPELWLLPDWVPIAPWRWWIHMRAVFLPMSFVWSRRFSHPLDPLTRSLRDELFTQPHSSIDFAAHRNSISPRDNYHPKTWILNTINWLLVNIWNPYLRSARLVQKAEAWTWKLMQMEDANTDFANLAPVNGPMHLLACYIEEGPDAYSVKRHRERMEDFLWVKDEGMLMNGTNGVQNWDTSFAIQAVMACPGFAADERWRPVLTKALEFLEDQQIREDCVDQSVCYRHPRKGAWGFSTREQGYTVSDCTSEAVKAVMQLQFTPGYPQLVSDDRIHDAIDIILTMQNPSGGCSSYEPTRGSEYLEYLNAAEVFGRIMVEYDYPECTTACVTALMLFKKLYPTYRTADIDAFVERALAYIRRVQRPDGSWYGSWGICFTYAGMFALEALAAVGETYESSERVRRACEFFIERQMEDGGWGETYRSCETGEWCNHERSQVVQTAWVCIALMEARFPEQEPIRKALRMVMGRQRANGEWLQEGIEGVFNKSCMISYPNYKFIFPIKALGMYAERYGDIELD
ncbi:lanosterol synthase [Coniosporium apollinis CBS 100218]|uniref:Terpene cyclase/mutase family member n=1 Tax=Coniosporium apollinis (strain CBS 100218) TaxID=1168221 RepID=R7YM81_CONA1|nr:lanosterol synthase [Coniosporium apollinis CBS 100218]EON63012.1 lanosterol synthase [Coniosporium apollinis CBS 100218]